MTRKKSDMRYMMAEKLKLFAESWSEETDAEMNQRPELDLSEADPDPSPIHERRPPQQRRRGIRHCLVADCNATFNGCSPMAKHILVSHCPEGIERADRMVRFLREIARSLHLPQEGRDDERVLDELRALVRRGFRPVLWEFRGKWCQSANALSAQLGLVPLTPMDLERVGQGLIVHPGMLAHPRVIATLLNRITRGERQRLRNLWPRTNWPRLNTPRPREGGPRVELPQ